MKNIPKIYWDLDGVLRDLAKEVWGYEPSQWNETIPNWNGTTSDYFITHQDIFFTASPAEYLNTVLKIRDKEGEIIHILTSAVGVVQTILWCNKYIGVEHYSIQFANSLEKLDIIGKNDILIDDYPYIEAETNPNIWIIDRKYNKHIHAITRILNPDMLEEKLIQENILKENKKVGL